MKNSTREKIRETVKEMVSNKVGSMIEDMFMDDTFEKELVDELNLESEETDEIWDILEKGTEGYIEEFHIENLVNAMTDSFMKKLDE